MSLVQHEKIRVGSRDGVDVFACGGAAIRRRVVRVDGGDVAPRDAADDRVRQGVGEYVHAEEL